MKRRGKQEEFHHGRVLQVRGFTDDLPAVNPVQKSFSLCQEATRPTSEIMARGRLVGNK